MVDARDRVSIGRFLANAVVLSLLWLILNGTDWTSWVLGIPAAVAGSALITRLPRHPHPRFLLRGVLAMTFFFLKNALVGAWLVGRRALQPDMKLRPALVEYRTSLPAGLPQVIFADTLTLLPGTLAVTIEKHVLAVHVLDETLSSGGELAQLEAVVARLFAPAPRSIA